MGTFWEGTWPDEAQQDPPKLVVPPLLSLVLKVLKERLYLISPTTSGSENSKSIATIFRSTKENPRSRENRAKILCWLKYSFRFFHNILQENLNFLANPIVASGYPCGVGIRFRREWVGNYC